MQRFWFASLLGLLALCAVGCGPRSIRADLDHHNLSDDDLLALLPQGQQAVIDVDVAALRAWPPMQALLSLIPARLLSSLSSLAGNPLQDVDALCVGATGLGSGAVESTLLVSGRLPKDKLWQDLARREGSREVTYHGMPLVEAGDRSLVQLSDRTWVLGSRLQVRQTIDIFRGVDPGLRKQSSLMNALAMAPTGKQGRPPVLAAVLLGSDLRRRAHEAGVLRVFDEAQSIALAVAVGDGIDVGVVVSYPFVQMAAEALSQVRAHAAELGSRSLVKLLHLDRFVSPLVSVAVPQSKKRLTPELHLAYRLPGYELDDLLRRVSQLMSLLQGRESGKEGERASPQPAEPVRK